MLAKPTPKQKGRNACADQCVPCGSSLRFGLCFDRCDRLRSGVVFDLEFIAGLLGKSEFLRRHVHNDSRSISSNSTGFHVCVHLISLDLCRSFQSCGAVSSERSIATRTSWARVRTPVFSNSRCSVAFTELCETPIL